MKKGIDLSTWQENVDYEALKQSGIEFALIRDGYGKDSGQKDDMFEKHYYGCKNAGIKVGCYHYSYCSCVENAIKEAENCLSYIEGKEFDLPVFLDLEEQVTKDLGIDQVTQICLIFDRRIKQAGYKAGVYANRDWFTNYIRPQALILEQNYIWLAQWYNEITADFPVDIWQFTNNLDEMHIDGNYLINEDLLITSNNNKLNDDKIEELAIQVINGKYGNGEERKILLGDNYNDVQDKVNDILLNENIYSIVQNVIKGKYGNGDVRKNILGVLYDDVQDKVNEILL